MKLIFIILVIFLKTGNVLSSDDIFNVNNVKVVKKPNNTLSELTNKAIKKGFVELIDRILLDKDKNKFLELNLVKIKELVSYYQILSNDLNKNNTDEVHYNIFFDREKFHNLFLKKGVAYSEITNKEIYLLPIIQKDEQIFIYSKNFYYENWNNVYNLDLIDFILPIENIEVIQKINTYKDRLLEISIDEIFKEYVENDLALVIIDERKISTQKIYLRAKVLGKKIDKNIKIEKKKMIEEDFQNKVIKLVSKEIINTIKSQNLIDIRTPSFLNAKLKVNKRNNLVELNQRLKSIKLIEDIYVSKLNNKDVYLKIKYLGKLNKIIKQLENQKIILKFINDEWSLKII